jgi:uncharacterized protein with HEPN domain
MSRDDAYIIDIVTAAKCILAFSQGMTKSELASDSKTQSAVLYQIAILGEAAKRLSPEFREAHPDIPWRRICAARNVMIHEYDKVDIDEIWKIIEIHVPELLNKLQPLMPKET